MFRVTKELLFCFGHRLMNYDGKCRQLHGHNARAVVTLTANELDETGMVTDFTDVRRTVGGWVDRTLDHTTILHKDDPLVPVLQQMGEAVLAIDDHPTTENLAKLIFEFVEQEGYPVTEVTLWETPTNCATYTPAGVGANSLVQTGRRTFSHPG